MREGRAAPRLLGKNEMPDLVNNATWMMTGNNLRLSTGIARRIYRIWLDAKMAKPWTRPVALYAAILASGDLWCDEQQ